MGVGKEKAFGGKRVTKQVRRAQVDAEQRRRWSEWLSGDGKVIRDAGFPAVTIENEAKWRDFVLHGTLHYHGGMPADFDLDLLQADTAADVLQFLERSLEPEVRMDSDLVRALRSVVARHG